MRSSLHIGGVEVEVVADDGSIEALIVDNYGSFLGAVERPARSIRFDSLQTQGRGQVATEMVDIAASFEHEGRCRAIVPADVAVLDELLGGAIALAAPARDALLMSACGAIVSGRAQVLLDTTGAVADVAALASVFPFLGDCTTLLQRMGGEWFAAASPFRSRTPGLVRSRRAPLAALHLHCRMTAASGPALTDAVRAHVVVPVATDSVATRITELALSIVNTVPVIEVADRSDLSLEEVLGVGSSA